MPCLPHCDEWVYLFPSTAENYARLKAGMEYKEVTSILGNPASCDDVIGFKSCKWGDEKSHITVRFAGDAVIMHSAENLR